MATAVAIASILAVVGSYVRAPNALLGVVFARACAAERDATERRQPRLRVDSEDTHVADADDGFMPSIRAGKAASPPRDRVAVPGVHLAAVRPRVSKLPSVEMAGDPGLAVIPTGPPTRERARLMVFLN